MRSWIGNRRNEGEGEGRKRERESDLPVVEREEWEALCDDEDEVPLWKCVPLDENRSRSRAFKLKSTESEKPHL